MDSWTSHCNGTKMLLWFEITEGFGRLNVHKGDQKITINNNSSNNNNINIIDNNNKNNSDVGCDT